MGRCDVATEFYGYIRTHADAWVSSATVTFLRGRCEFDTWLLQPDTRTLLTDTGPRSAWWLLLPSLRTFGTIHPVPTSAAEIFVFVLTSPTVLVAGCVLPGANATSAELRRLSSPWVLPDWLLRSSSAS